MVFDHHTKAFASMTKTTAKHLRITLLSIAIAWFLYPTPEQALAALARKNTIPKRKGVAYSIFLLWALTASCCMAVTPGLPAHNGINFVSIMKNDLMHHLK
jgi:hypothetical protein